MNIHMFFTLASNMMNHVGTYQWQKALDVCVRIQQELEKKLKEESNNA